MATLARILGCKHALIQAPMAGTQGWRLAAAVSSSGALGSLPAAMLDECALRRQLEELQSACGRNAFNLNFFCHALPSLDSAAEDRWRRRLQPLYHEFGLSQASISTGAIRQPFNAGMAAIVEEFRPRVVSFHFGLPSADLVARVKATGAAILSSATTVDEGRWLQDHGADAVIAQGLEAGGHRGHFLSHDLTRQSGTFALLPQLATALSVPVIAAGGIASAACVRAAMQLGASGVQAGTAFLLAAEADTHPLHRAALQSPAAQHTALTNVFTGRPARSIVNRAVAELGPLCSEAPSFPLANAAMAPLRTAQEAKGSADFSPLWCGQNRGSSAVERPAAKIVAGLISGTPLEAGSNLPPSASP